MSRGPHRFPVALFLCAFAAAAAAKVREAEDRCIHAMHAAVDRMEDTLRLAQARTGKAVVADDGALFQTMGKVTGDVGFVCNQAKAEASDEDRVLIDDARSALTTYLTIYGLPGGNSVRDNWLAAMERLQAEGGHARHL